MQFRQLMFTIPSASSGVFLLAMGASAMNQFQDRDFDARMERTRLRAIPAGALRPAAVFTIAVAIGFWRGSWLHEESTVVKNRLRLRLRLRPRSR